MPLPYRIERTRNRTSRAVLRNDVVVIRLARNLSLTEEQRHIDSLYGRMQKMVLRHRNRPTADPFFEPTREQLRHVADLVEYINAQTLRVRIGRIRIKPMTSQWGSCSSQGHITLNTALLRLPEHFLEYVIIHELAHRLVRNHSRKFWELVEHHCPDAREARRELRKYHLRRK